MENPVTSVRKNLALKAAVPVFIGVLGVAYICISAYTGTFNPMKWRAKASTPAASNTPA